MNAQICLEILRNIKDVAFATVDEEGLPQIRMIDVMLVEDHRLYFCTARGKDFYRQLIRSKNVAITGMNQSYQMVRLNGTAEKLSDQKAWIDRIFAENPGMNQVYPGDNRYILEAFCISRGEVDFFDLGVSPIERHRFVLENSTPLTRGFTITQSCVGCKKCLSVCPQKCILPGKPFQISQEHCLHCGLCAEICPTHSIIRKDTL